MRGFGEFFRDAADRKKGAAGHCGKFILFAFPEFIMEIFESVAKNGGERKAVMIGVDERTVEDMESGFAEFPVQTVQVWVFIVPEVLVPQHQPGAWPHSDSVVFRDADAHFGEKGRIAEENRSKAGCDDFILYGFQFECGCLRVRIRPGVHFRQERIVFFFSAELAEGVCGVVFPQFFSESVHKNLLNSR